MTGLYIHIPFCKSKCFYCDFYSLIYNQNEADQYIDVITKQLKNLNEDFSTIYIGGGTPTVLSLKQIKKLLYSLHKFIKKANEITIEANPESLNEDKISLLLQEGINRISIGVQSFNDEKLKRLGRIHSSVQAKDAVNLAKKCGFKNISIDLIFGVSGETFKQWQKDLEEAVYLPITHISTYMLTYEKKTLLYKLLKKNLIELPDEKLLVKMYKFALEFLPKNLFYQYEISNFSKKGFFCKHNLNYWENNPYIGLGPSAFSYKDGIRSKNVASVVEYIRKIRQNKNVIAFSEKLSALKRAKETASLKIRTIDGIDFDWFYKKTGFDFLALEKESLKKLLEAGLIKSKKKNAKNFGICLTKKGILFSDTVSSMLL